MSPPPLPRPLRRQLRRAGRAAVGLGVPASWVGYRWVPREPLAEHLKRTQTVAERIRVVEPAAVASNPLPMNVHRRDQLPADAGWWGYSFRDVPARPSGATTLVRLPDVRVLSYGGPGRPDEFHPALISNDGRSIDLREMRFRPPHGPLLRDRRPPLERERVTWIAERVYDNHSHWLTAHLPKLLLLRELGELDDVLLPGDLPGRIEESLRLVGLDPAHFPRHDGSRVLRVGELTVLDTDRFRPDLLRRVQEALVGPGTPTPTRRVFISRAGASRRRLLDEDAVWPLLASAGFERVRMEELDFAEQVALMRETQVLLGLHGAGLTNMLACPPGADVVEIADLSFPNPNFYAVASAAGHRYWLLPGEAVGGGSPVDRDVRVGTGPLTRLLRELNA